MTQTDHNVTGCSPQLASQQSQLLAAAVRKQHGLERELAQSNLKLKTLCESYGLQPVGSGKKRDYNITVNRQRTSQRHESNFRSRMLEAVTEFLNLTYEDGWDAMQTLIRAILEDSNVTLPVFQYRREAQESAIKQIEQHWDAEVSAIIKCKFQMSYENLDRLRHLLSYHTSKNPETGKWTHVRRFLDMEIPLGMRASTVQVRRAARKQKGCLMKNVLYDHELKWGKTFHSGRKLVGHRRVQMPVLAGKHAAAALINKLANDVGYVVSEDQKSVTISVKKSLLARITNVGDDYFTFENNVSTEPIVLQVLGDGYRHFRREKVVQLVYKLAHNNRPLGNVEAGASLTGAISSLDLVAVWSGSESHKEISEKAKPCLELSEEITEAGGLEVRWDGTKRTIAVDQVAGGDMAWIHACAGQRNWEWCLWCEMNKDHFSTGEHSLPRTNARCIMQAHLFVDTAHEQRGVYVIEEVSERHEKHAGRNGMLAVAVPKKIDYDTKYTVTFFEGDSVNIRGKYLQPGFQCPSDECKKQFPNPAAVEQEIKFKGAKLTQHARTHKGANHKVKLLWPKIERQKWLVCILHQILNTTGGLYRLLIAKHCTTKTLADAITDLLARFGVTVPPPKSSGKNAGKIGQVARCQFLGEDAERFLENGRAFLAVLWEVGSEKYKDGEQCFKKLIEYQNLVFERNLPSKELGKALKAKGREVIDAVGTATGDLQCVGHYFHALVCAIPRQAVQYQLMNFSGQALENQNRNSKSISSNRRYTKNKLTGAESQHKMGIGMLEQIVKPQLAMEQLNADDRVKGTKRRRQRDDGQTGRRLLVLQPLEGQAVQVKPRGAPQVAKKEEPDSGAANMETVAIIAGLEKHKHHNGKAATLVKRLDADRWVVRLDNHKEVRVKEENLASRRQVSRKDGPDHPCKRHCKERAVALTLLTNRLLAEKKEEARKSNADFIDV